jgi:hypothetical protein
MREIELWKERKQQGLQWMRWRQQRQERKLIVSRGER